MQTLFTAYSYIVRAKTSVNGREVVVAAPIVTVNVGDVAPTSGRFDILIYNHAQRFIEHLISPWK